ncbi:M20 family metallopeptidase [Aquincola tertiaricarbonis]|uniref:M20 family metallopeptidase n=1 Tax=Aquincola tertiaricarbonis TaxID=391953 RepID=A0ABY4SC23_AQUTE|nr:M20 aminoacylase family protein [Aquincola tertiaricarbonis]URI10543.1 M20 family metallopeptidase [Aquincola tertiaricarbonis]
MQLIESILADAASIASLRRDIHAHPELCFEEVRTSDLIAKALTDWGIEVHRGLGKTGVVGIVRNGTSQRAVGIRADIDALPMTEHNHFPHASKYAGKMHACGHDGHTAMLLAAAKHLSKHRNFDGTVYLVFQPAEEGGGGAREMIKDGLFDLFPMEAMFGAHNWPGLKVGQFALSSGPIYASSNEFKITVKGKGAHGAMPHLGIDPVPAACQMVQAFQTIISRNKRPIDTGVISVTMIHTGEATNVIPERCVMEGTVRTFTTEVLDLLQRRMQEVAEHTAAAFECTVDFEFVRNYPPTINHDAETEFAKGVLAEVVGADNVVPFEPTMGAEDFSFFLQKIPGCYLMIGNGEGAHREGGHGLGPCMLHNPSYDFNDDLIPLGATAWVRMAERWLAPR